MLTQEQKTALDKIREDAETSFKRIHEVGEGTSGDLQWALWKLSIQLSATCAMSEKILKHFKEA